MLASRLAAAAVLASVVATGCGAAERRQAAKPAGCPDRSGAPLGRERENSGPAWSPDGKSIAFASTRAGRSDLYVVEVSNCDVRRVTVSGGATEPDWSPDGSQLVFMRNVESIWIVGVDGKGERRLTRGMFPAWSPDGTWIAFDAGGYGDGPRELWAIRPDGTGRRRLAAGRWNLTAAWSPDGESIAWARSAGGTEQIWRMRADGSDLRPVSPGEVNGDSDPTWAPDGAQIAYSGSTAVEGLTIFVVSARGGKARKLLPGKNVSNPDWSPDGSLIAIEVYGATGTDLSTISPQGGGLRPLTAPPER